MRVRNAIRVKKIRVWGLVIAGNIVLLQKNTAPADDAPPFTDVCEPLPPPEPDFTDPELDWPLIFEGDKK